MSYKVDVFHSILAKLASGNLKTNAKWHEPYGLSPQGVSALALHYHYATSRGNCRSSRI